MGVRRWGVLLRASIVVTPTGLLADGEVVVEGGRIVAVRRAPAGRSVPDRVLAPGFVDLQVNGMGDVDCGSASTPAEWNRLGEEVAATGVTSWCPTLVTAPLDAYAPRIEAIAAAMRDQRDSGNPAILGAHLEGPFLGGAPGAHPPQWVRPVELEWLGALPLGEVVRVVTLAPEADGALEAIRLLAGRGVLVALGHSTASFDEAVAAADAGARLVTHLFNGMAPLHHRNPGLVGAALTDARLTPTLIADGVHVHRAALALAARAKGAGGWALVTDAVGHRSGRLAGRSVAIVDGAPRLPDGTLAGSSLTMDAAVRRMVVECGVPLDEAVAAASAVPAALVGATDRGALEPGRRGDVVVLSPPPSLAVEDVVIA